MCGIAGIYVRSDKTKMNLNAILDTMLGEIADRGGDATGFIALDAKGVAEWQRAAVDVQDFVPHRRQAPKGTRVILAHTRWATQGHAGFMENNHPLRRGPFYVIHNGHVTNDSELFTLSERDRYAQVDTEAIAAIVAHYGSLDRVDEAMEQIQGAAAIAVVDERKPDEVVLARGYNSPLNVLVTDKVVMWGSTERTVRMAYKKHIGKLPRRQKIESLPEGVMLYVTPAGVQRIEFKAYEPVWVKDTWDPSKYRTPYAYETQAGACEIQPARALPPAHWWDEDKEEVYTDTSLGGYQHDKWRAEDVLDKTKETDCDECGGTVTLMNVIRVPEPDSDFEWKLCEDCAELWERLADEEWERTNAKILTEMDR